MNVFKKLKDVLFDVEEDIPVITKDEEKVVKVKEENPIKEIKMPKEEQVEPVKPIIPKEEKKEVNEPKFNFPLDFEEELPIRNNSKNDYFDDEPILTSRTSIRERESFYDEKPEKKEKSYEYDYRRLDIEDKKKNETKQFKISPIISPVYGILDQNYTKDDVIVRSESSKSPSLDDVRKKAYGTKKKAVSEAKPEIDEFEEPLKTLDEILIDKEEEIKEPEIKETAIKDEAKVKEPIKEEVFDDELPDEPYADEEVKLEANEDDSIESDLFNLIDSMYEERNEREAEE